MIPIQLTLRNFMSYGDEPTVIEFDDMHVICLSGENGHGKSALLDAITWALWGETRLGRQNHEQLVRIGSDEMAVVLRFRNGGNVYQVRRQRSRKSSGNIWELQIEEPGGSLRPLTAQGAADTGRTITDVLRMSYETFLNSAYLRQGKADEFVRQTAKQRKEILSEILDLSRYDDLEALSRTRMREASDRALDENRALNGIEAELAASADAPDHLRRVDEQIERLGAQQAVLGSELDEISDKHAGLKAKRAKLSEMEAAIREMSGRKEQHSRQIAAEQLAIETARELLAQRKRIESDMARSDELHNQIEQLQDDALRFQEMERRRLQLSFIVESAEREVASGLATAEAELKELLSLVEALPQLDKRIAVLEGAESKFSVLQRRQQASEADRQALQVAFAELRADKKRCDFDLSEAEKRLDRVLNQNEVCEICGSPLPASKLQLLEDECAENVAALQTRLRDLKHQGSEAKNKIDHLAQDLSDCAEESRRLQENRVELARLQQHATQLRERQAREPELRREIGLRRRQLSEGGIASAERDELAVLLPEQSRIASSQTRLASLQKEFRGLRLAESAFAKLQNAERDLPLSEARQESARAMLSEIESQVEQLRIASAEAPQLDRDLSQLLSERATIQAQLATLSLEAQQAQREHGRLQNVIERSTALAQQKIAREAAQLAAINDKELYTMLASAFGKQGLQALIIENALPELETDANELLQKLTDGQMSLTLQTTRQAKSKASGEAQIETLDIVISDALGSRALEIYSGGESFRISFALRIALSKLLARHAGAQLQTLIIDEGFGTQDARGREKLVDSIFAVQSEFAQIIVITHVDEIKDAFPNRIEVYKTPTGSEVNLVVGAALG